MKRIVLTASVMSAMILTAAAQQKTALAMTANSVATIGVHAGGNLYNINGKNATGAELNNQLNTGFSAGADVAIPLGSGYYLQPGVDFTQKGAEMQNGTKTTLSYIDIPVNFVYRPIVGTGNLVLGFGPYVGFGVGGKVTTANGTSTKVEYRNQFDQSLPRSTTQLRKSDAGANFLAGYEFINKLSLNLKAQLGLKDINPDIADESSTDQTRWRNTGFGLSLGYRF